MEYSAPKTLGDVQDMGPEAYYWYNKTVELQAAIKEDLERDKLADELADEQHYWLRESMGELYSLTKTHAWQSNRSPVRMRAMIQDILDNCSADY